MMVCDYSDECTDYCYHKKPHVKNENCNVKCERFFKSIRKSCTRVNKGINIKVIINKVYRNTNI